MQYDEFKQRLLEQLNIAAVSSEHIKEFIPSSSMKPNVNLMDSITVQYEDSKNFRPCFYPEEMFADYEDGRSMEDIVDSIISHSEYSYSHTPQIEFGNLTSEAMKANFYLQLVNEKTNPLIKDNCAHFQVNDLIAVPRCRVDIDGEAGSFLINRKIQSEMKLTDDELLSIARKNTLEQPYTIKTMSEVLSVSMGMEIPDDGLPQIYILSNEEGINGSIHIINPRAMQEASKMMDGENIYLIPCSIHELLLLPESMVDDPSTLSMMCSEVNKTVVRNEEVLSGNIYRYDSQHQKISICNNLDDLNRLQEDTQQIQINHRRQAM